MKILLCSAVVLTVLGPCLGARILALVPTPAKSHANLFERLVTELARKGHDVTYVSSFKISKPPPKLKEVVLPDMHHLIVSASTDSEGKGQDMNMFDSRHMPRFMSYLILPQMGRMVCEAVLQQPEVQQLINSDEHFDLVLGEAFSDESVLAGFSHKFKAPIITVATFMPNVWTNYMVGNPAPASYIPEPLFGYGTRMTFFERLANSLATTASELIYVYHQLPIQDALMRRFFGSHLPPLHEMIKNVSLVLVNHHHTMAFPRPYNPNVVEIGGYHVAPPKELPKDLKAYVDASKDGVILFSMGSNLKSSQMPEEQKKLFLNTFAKLKQNVIWKFEDETLKGIPKNLKIMSWVPQSDILAHPNTKLFITHGGLLSTTEALVRGVPVIGMPIFGDQPLNMQIVENAGLGKNLDFDDLTEEKLLNAINEILQDPRYREVTKAKSALLNDTPLPALDTAVYWVEYVIRHKGAPHLRSAAQDLSWFQLHLVDVFALLTVAALLTLAVQFYLARLLLRKIFGKAKKTDKATQRKKVN